MTTSSTATRPKQWLSTINGKPRSTTRPRETLRLMTTPNLIPTALAHLDAAESLAQADDNVLLAADVRYARTTLTLSTGISQAAAAIPASDLDTHLERASAALDQCVDSDPGAAVDLLAARAELTVLLQKEAP